MSKYCKVDGVLTVVDCKHFLTQLNRERQKDAVNEPAQQVGFADKLLLNKVDVCTKEQIEEAKETIRGINAFVPIRECTLSTHPDAVPLGDLLDIDAFDVAKLLTKEGGTQEVDLIARTEIEEEAHGGGHEAGHGEGHGGGHDSGHGDGHGHDDCGEDHGDASHSGHGGTHDSGHGHGKAKSRHDTDVRSMVLEVNGNGLDYHRFQNFVRELIEERSVDLYRYKGVLACKQESATLLHILQGVHDMPEFTFSGEWPEGKPMKTQVVIIGRKLDEKQCRERFARCVN